MEGTTAACGHYFFNRTPTLSLKIWYGFGEVNLGPRQNIYNGPILQKRLQNYTHLAFSNNLHHTCLIGT